MDFTDGTEKGLVKKFLKAKIQRLSETDQQLPQIGQLTNLLVRGIGVHHAGMLPFMKEIVEILFADGLLKMVFATTTFAIGLNMPARAVFFTKIYKFSGGTGEELIETSEYLQMAGRAGRRGKDATGSCLIALDRAFARNIPTIDDFEKILENKGTPLESKLKLSYTMAMNVVKQESMVIDDLLKTSWFESESEKERIDAAKNATFLLKKIQQSEVIDCPFGCTQETVGTYTMHHIEACERNRSIAIVCQKDLAPLVCIESMHPSLYGETVIIITPLSAKAKDDDTLLCLFIKEGYKRQPRFHEQDPLPYGYRGKIYYEYIRLRTNHVGAIYNEYLGNHVKSFLGLTKAGVLEDKTVDAIIKAFIGLRNFTLWKVGNNCNIFVHERAQALEKMRNVVPTGKCQNRNSHLE